MIKEKVILIVSNEPWGEIWFSKHHYAHELSRNNFVFFINPPGRWRMANWFKPEVTITKLSDSLSVIDYENFFPSFFLKFNNKIVSRRIFKKLRSIQRIPDIFWSFDPIRLFEPSVFNVKKSVFHAVDRYRFVHPAEMIFHRNVDAFICVSRDFVEQYEPYGKPVLVVPHGLSEDEFKFHEKVEIPYKDYILYVGTVDIRLDYPHIIRLLESFPNERFVFLGGIKSVNHEDFKKVFIDKQYPNAIYMPPVHAQKLKYYISAAKCCIAPMKKDHPGNLISHHKILQYLAHGKAVFSPVFTEYVSFNHLVYMDNNENLLIEKMSYFLLNGDKKDLDVQRISLAKEHLYTNHLNRIMNFLND